MTTEYFTRRHRKYISGVHIMPVAGADGTLAQFVNLHAPYGIESVFWAAAKEGQPPAVPSPSLFGNTNLTFLGGEEAADMPMLLPSLCGHLWVIAGVYHYGLALPAKLDSDFPVGIMPFDPMPLAQGTYPSVNFMAGILAGSTIDFQQGLNLQQSKGPGG
jgi:hypothetical protein